MMVLDKTFYSQDTTKIARNLLGCFLITTRSDGVTIGKIVETESYPLNDPASHGFKGPNHKNAAMFGEAGKAYIYFTYGMYYCLNVVTGPTDQGEAVLIRALEPIEGVELMQKRRNKHNLRELCSGPAKLVIALGITPKLNGTDLQTGPLQILSSDHFGKVEKPRIITTERVGISKAKDSPLRFHIPDNPFVSKLN